MEMLTLYARKEPTTDDTWLKYGSGKIPTDVVLYRDEKATDMASRIPWHYTKAKPRKSQKKIIHNCWRFKLQWIPELTAA